MPPARPVPPPKVEPEKEQLVAEVDIFKEEKKKKEKPEKAPKPPKPQKEAKLEKVKEKKERNPDRPSSGKTVLYWGGFFASLAAIAFCIFMLIK